ncbi:uncharacterized protein LOC110842246 isoform X2 [Folsomia candida]|uniref:uncharacterized protein LOC110842246 isoform X2 n=1 Tax=Folsomia candida TaxID=158441 RepID=UPI001604ED5B|nr:uncharacterized protein LOC110842246 isoform X2 [Folsomia candida]
MVQVTTTQRYDFGDDDLLGLLDFNNGTNFAPEFDPLTPSSLPFCTSRHISSAHNGVINSTSSSSLDGFTIQELKYLTYGIIWPSICALGMLGNVLNLIVLNQPNMKGTAYIYMRGYSSAALMAIVVAIPFAVRVLFHNEVGPWSSLYQAFFHTYLELYLGNSCLGIGVMMLVALTMERFVAVCHPEKSRAMQGSKKAYIIIASIPILTLIAHSPHMMRFSLVQCQSEDGLEKYQGKENQQFLSSTLYLVYKWFISLIFRLIPTILLAYLNLRIIVAYRRTCARRRLMTGKTSRDESKKFAEESRIMLLLGSTSVLFFVCVTPMVILSLMFTKTLLKSFSFQHSDWLLRFPLGQS